MKSSSSESAGQPGSAGSSGSGVSGSGSGSFDLRNLSKVILPPLGGVTSGHSQSHGGTDKWVISPLDSRYRCWETFMVLLVAYSAWVYPFEVAFMNAVPKGGLEVADIVVDLFFAVDIVLTFFVAYIDSRTQLLVRDRKRIAFRSYTVTLEQEMLACLHGYVASNHYFPAASEMFSTPRSCYGKLPWHLGVVSHNGVPTYIVAGQTMVLALRFVDRLCTDLVAVHTMFPIIAFTPKNLDRVLRGRNNHVLACTSQKP